MSEQETHENGKPGDATVRRFIDRENDVLVTVGDFGPLFAAYLDHVRRWEAEPDGLSHVMMRQGLGAAILHMANRPADEAVGWTIHVHRPPTNLFLTADGRDATVAGRVYTEGVKESEESRMYVQISRDGGSPRQSAVEIEGVDVLEMFEQFYRRSEQLPARFLELSDDRYLMVLALPEAKADWVYGLTPETARALADSDLKSLGEGTFRFQCGCTSERMLEVVHNLFSKDPDELFRGDDGVEVYCPRCGRRWWVDRAAFEQREGVGGDGTSSPEETS